MEDAATESRTFGEDYLILCKKAVAGCIKADVIMYSSCTIIGLRRGSGLYRYCFGGICITTNAAMLEGHSMGPLNE